MQPDSFDQIYQDYFDSVYRYALSLSGNPQTAEDIAQETFFKAMRTLDQFQGKSSLRSWLCAMCAGHGTILAGESPATGIYRQV